MKRTMKKLTSSMLVSAMVTTGVLPVYVFSEESNVVNAMELNQEMYDDNLLGSADLSSMMEFSGANTLISDLAALTLLKQPDIHFESKEEFKALDLMRPLSYHQEKLRQDAVYWLNDLKDQLFQTNEYMIGYIHRFQSLYDMLMEAAVQNNSDSLIKGFEALQSEAEQNKKHVDELLEHISSFSSELAADVDNFDQDADQVIQSILGDKYDDYSGFETYLSDIKSYQQDIRQDLLEIETGAADKLMIAGIVGAGVTFITGISMIPAIYYSLVIPGASFSSAMEGGPYLVLQYMKGLVDPAMNEFMVSAFETGAFPGLVGIIFTSAMGSFEGWGNTEQGKYFDEHIDKLRTTVEQMSIEAQEAAVLNLFKNQADALTEAVNSEMITLKKMSNEWDSINLQLKILIEQVKNKDTDLSATIPTSLEDAKEDWEKMNRLAEILYIHDYNEELE